MVKNSGGFSVVEVLLSVAVLALLVTAFAGTVLYGEEGTVLAGNRNRATFLADEGIEALRNIRDASASGLAVGTFGLTTGGNVWNLSGSSDVVDIFTRTETVATATESADRKNITSTITWQQNLQRTGNVTIQTRLSGWNRVFGNWATPSQQSIFNLAGNQAGLKVQVQGDYAYVVRNGGSPNFAVINVTNPAAPTLTGSLTLSGIPNNLAVSGNYAYIASTDNSQELQVVDISNPAAPTQVASNNPATNADGNGVYVSGGTAIVARAGSTSNFIIYNVSNPLSPSQTAVISLAGPLYEVFVIGNYAFVSTGDNASELQVINISNLAAPTLVASLNLATNADSVTLTGYQSPDSLFLGKNDGNVAVVDIGNPLVPSLLSTYAAGTSVNDVTLGVSSGYLLMSTSNGAREFQVLDVTTLSSPVLLGLVNLTSALNGVAYDQTRDRAYVVGIDNPAEFMVMKPL